MPNSLLGQRASTKSRNKAEEADALVSSRISRAKKEAGVAALSSLGATTSELINSAFDYVIENHRLPAAGQRKKPSRASLASFVAKSTLPVDWSGENRSYKEIMRVRKVDEYESLA